jgi:hypothetical protein
MKGINLTGKLIGSAVLVSLSMPYAWGCDSDKIITLRESSKTVIDARKSYVSGAGNEQVDPSSWQGGDTICIQTGTNASPGVKIRNFWDVDGLDELHPITFINVGEVLIEGDDGDSPFYIQNSHYLHITGTGTDTQPPGLMYGFVIDGNNMSSQGLKITNRSSDIELDHIEIANIKKIGLNLTGVANCADASAPEGVSYLHVYDLDGDGFSQKGRILGYDGSNNPIYDPGDIDDVISQDSFTMKNILIHDTYIHDTGHEAMYLGNNLVDYLYNIQTGGRGPAMGSEVVCAYQNPNLPPDYQPAATNTNDPLNARLDTIKVYNNRMVNIGWDAINVKSAARSCYIYDNYIENHGELAREAGKIDQTSGIDTTPNVECNIYRNIINGGAGSGIFLYGVGGVVANNLIINSGENAPSGGSKSTGIEIGAPKSSKYGDLSDWYSGRQFEVYNNTVISARSYAYKIKVEYQMHKVMNNLAVATDSVPPGNDPGYKLSSNVWASDNYYAETETDPAVGFVDPENANYHLSDQSELIDAGTDEPLNSAWPEASFFDLDGESRWVNAFDIGAYEYH